MFFFLGLLQPKLQYILRKNGPFSSFSMEIHCGRKSSEYYSPEV